MTDPLDRIEELVALLREFHKDCGGCPVEELCDASETLVAVARAARDLSARIVDGPEFNLGEIFNAAGRLDAALARLEAGE